MLDTSLSLYMIEEQNFNSRLVMGMDIFIVQNSRLLLFCFCSLTKAVQSTKTDIFGSCFVTQKNNVPRKACLRSLIM